MVTKKTIKQVRPKLRKVAPLTFYISLGFVLVNFAIWFLLVNIPQAAIREVPLPVVNEFITYQVWGYWFLFLSAGMGLSLYINSYNWLKRFLMLGLISKLLWVYALLAMLISGYMVFTTFILWTFLAWVQAWTIIYFAPTVYDAHDVLPDDERLKDVN